MWRIVFIASFFLMTVAPALQMAAGTVRERPINEKRVLAKPPQSLLEPHAFVRQANAWYNDHFGLRSSLIRLKTEVDYKVFRTSEHVFVGTDGWLFYRRLLERAKPEVESYLAEHEGEVLTGIREFTAALKRNGIQPIMLVNKLADRYYPENVPAAVPRLPASPRVDRLIEKIAEIDTLLSVPVDEILRKTARERLIFHKTDFHWNDPSGFEIAKKIVSLASQEGGKPTPWRHPLEIGSSAMDGGISEFFPLLRPIRENVLVVKRTWTEPPETKWLRNQGIFTDVIRTPSSPGGDELGQVAILGDSFTLAFIRSGMHLYFGDLYRTTWDRTKKVSTFARNIPVGTRYVILQFIETRLPALKAFADANDIGDAVRAIDNRPK